MTAPWRWAVYWLPEPLSPLGELGSAVLGRCVRTGRPVPRPRLPGLTDAAWARAGSQAAVYGFHATLVAPFRTERAESELLARLDQTAAKLRPFALEDLTVKRLAGGCAALTLPKTPPELTALEKTLVESFSPLRRPPAATEIRRRGRLTSRQLAYAEQWGYPYVLEEFMFHLTLSDPPNPESPPLEAYQTLFEPKIVGRPMLDAVTLCVQPRPDAPFEAVAERPLGRPDERGLA